MIKIKNLSVSYGEQAEQYEALRDVSLELCAGETCAIIGASGCGKSTLLKVLASIITDFNGLVEINGSPVRPLQQTIGFIPQNYGLLSWRNVRENILLGVKIKHNASCSKDAYALLLQQLGLSGLEHRYPGELSGGQQQRVALARSFLLNPDLLLMDEPFSALDAITREDIQTVFLEAWRLRPVTTVLVTHHVEEAVYGRKIVIMAGAPGYISQIIDNNLFGCSNSRSTPEFFRLCIELRKKLKEDWRK